MRDKEDICAAKSSSWIEDPSSNFKTFTFLSENYYNERFVKILYDVNNKTLLWVRFDNSFS